MAKKTTNFILGLFVILGFFLGVGIIIWVGVTSYFQKGTTYVSYFDESVEGLQADSSVKYRGVDVGRVLQIRVAPDNKLIGVVMKINLRGDLSKTTVAQVRSAGITGVKFIGLERPKPEDKDLSPKIEFPSEYPIIPSVPSEIQKLLAGVNVIVDKFQQIDTKGISDQVLATTKNIGDFVQSKEMTQLLAKLEGTAANLERITAKVDKAVGGGKLEEILVETRNGLKEMNVVMGNLKKDLQGMKLADTASRYRGVAREVEGVTQNLQRASATLEQFLERIYERPPDLLFGKPPQKRWNE
jgi:phospholipid/cholesterol/gamma-HCH transport system substrate-binding protein